MKEKKNVQVAEEKTLEQDKPQVNAGVNTVNDAGQPRSLPFDVSNVNPKSLEMAEKFGIPIKAILSWAQSVEERLNVISEEMPKAVGREIESAIARAKQQQATASGQAPNPGGVGMGSLLQLLPALLGSGGGDSELYKQAAVEALKAQTRMTQAITNAVVSKIFGKATTDVADAVVG